MRLAIASAMLIVLGFGASFVVGFFFASFGEYWAHRLMHVGILQPKKHKNHHRWNEGQGVLGELFDYFVAGAPVAGVLGVVLSLATRLAFGVALFAGALAFGFVAAFAHQLQHENPRRCFWMAMPIHYVHHDRNMWGHNFGVVLDWWDRLFGTYRAVDWLGEKERAAPPRGFLALHWGRTPSGRKLGRPGAVTPSPPPRGTPAA